MEITYDQAANEIETTLKTTHKLTAKIHDISNQALAAANKAINYEFHNLNEQKQQDTYISRFNETLQKGIKEDLQLELNEDNDFLHEGLRNKVLTSLGLMTGETLKGIVQARGNKYQARETADYLRQSIDSIARNQYASLANTFMKSEEHRKHITKYLGLENKIKHELLDSTQLQGLIDTYSKQGEVPKYQIPARLRKEENKLETEIKQEENKVQKATKFIQSLELEEKQLNSRELLTKCRNSGFTEAIIDEALIIEANQTIRRNPQLNRSEIEEKLESMGFPEVIIGISLSNFKKEESEEDLTEKAA